MTGRGGPRRSSNRRCGTSTGRWPTGGGSPSVVRNGARRLRAKGPAFATCPIGGSAAAELRCTSPRWARSGSDSRGLSPPRMAWPESPSMRPEGGTLALPAGIHRSCVPPPARWPGSTGGGVNTTLALSNGTTFRAPSRPSLAAKVVRLVRQRELLEVSRHDATATLGIPRLQP